MNSYRAWLNHKTNKYIVPGVNVPLSIEYAWASLQVWEKPSESSDESLKEKLDRYHEWEKLSRKGVLKRDAQDITSFGKRVVILGGPGSGKSTLAQRTVNQLLNQEESIIFVKLSGVSKEMQSGKLFEDALISNTMHGYPDNQTSLKSNLLENANVLVADGLDECGYFVREVSEALRDWGTSRPDMKIIITSRPIGYEPAFFNDYYHVEVLPLDEQEIYDYARKLIETLKEGEHVEKELNQFKSNLEKNKTASVAARSPLLLNFLIQLSIYGKSFGTYRAELYSKILEEWISKSSRGENLELSQPVAVRSLEWIGWNIHCNNIKEEKSNSESNLITGLADFLLNEMELKQLEARKLADLCLKYWLEKGVLENIKVGFDNTYTFIHLNLGEYMVARYFSNLPKDKQRQLLMKYYRMPIWREIFLLAGGIKSARLIVERLLLEDSEELPLFNEMVLAAAVLLETDPIPDLNKQVIERLTRTISSPYPILAFEAVKVFGGLAEQASEWTFSLTTPLLNHDQFWTKLVATQMSLKAGMKVFNTKEYLEWLRNDLSIDNKIVLRGEVNPGWSIWQDTVVLGLRQILNNGTTEEEIIRVSDALSQINLSLHSLEEIERIIKEFDINKLFNSFTKKFVVDVKKFDFMSIEKRMLIGDKLFIKNILDVISKNKQQKFSEVSVPFLQLANLVEGMEVGQQIAGDFYSFNEGGRDREVHSVLNGMIAVLNIDVDTLNIELQHLMSQLDQSERTSFYHILPDVPTVHPDWDKALSLDINLSELVSALGHPVNTVAYNAARLLSSGVGGADVQNLIIENLDKGDSQYFYYSSKIIPEIFEGEAVNVILQRLAGEPHIGFQYLYETICNLPDAHNNERVCEILTEGIQSKNESLSKAAAKALGKISTTINYNVINDVMLYWKENGVLCRNCDVYVKESSCPECNMVPENPIPELLKIMQKTDYLTSEDWIEYCVHPLSRVQEVATQGLSKSLNKDTLKLSQLIEEVRVGHKPVKLLNAVFLTDTINLIKVKQQLSTLIDSTKIEVRKKLIQEIAVSKWLKEEEASQIIEKALSDKDPSVRDQAIRTARSITLD
ncbi:NACHT domain-containing protein [Bacillus mycoides]|uniref:NACHT domain-containing protein n=1 Tax=Bacillus mycoides TaxID=1405 RepID=UPI0011A62A1E|nr:NACHT domain-containing protein [Bacillus mycoides]